MDELVELVIGMSSHSVAQLTFWIWSPSSECDSREACDSWESRSARRAPRGTGVKATLDSQSTIAVNVLKRSTIAVNPIKTPWRPQLIAQQRKRKPHT